jgi:hypothetical protein
VKQHSAQRKHLKIKLSFEEVPGSNNTTSAIFLVPDMDKSQNGNINMTGM